MVRHEEIAALVEQIFAEVWVSDGEPHADPDLSVAATPKDKLERLLRKGKMAAQLGDESQRRILERTGRWLATLQKSAEGKHRQVADLHERWARDAGLRQAGLFQEGAEVVRERLQRLVSGLAHTVRNERPVTKEPIRFRVDWTDGDGLAQWEGAPGAVPFSLRQAAEDNAELIGGWEGLLIAAVAAHLVRDLREGILELPHLPRCPESTAATTWFRYEAPRLKLVPEQDAPALPPQVVAEPSVDLTNTEAQIEHNAPVLADYYERALAIAARQGKTDPEFAKVLARARADRLVWQDVLTRVQQSSAATQPIRDLITKLAQVTGLETAALLRFLVIPLWVMALIHRKEAQRSQSAEHKAQALLSAIAELVR